MSVCKQAEGDRVHFWCPACDDAHGITLGLWGWNGDLEEPTFSPSIKVSGTQWKPKDHFYKPQHNVEPGGSIVCHSYVTKGKIQFLSDCTHNLAGQTVDLPEWPYDE